MISCKKSVTKNDRIKYFKEIVEVNMKFHFKRRKQKLSLKQKAVIRKKTRRKKRYLYCVELEVSMSFFMLTESKMNVVLTLR